VRRREGESARKELDDGRRRRASPPIEETNGIERAKFVLSFQIRSAAQPFYRLSFSLCFPLWQERERLHASAKRAGVIEHRSCLKTGAQHRVLEGAAAAEEKKEGKKTFSSSPAACPWAGRGASRS
jgi:hypothetical protein